MLQIFMAEKDRLFTFAIDGLIEACDEASLKSCVEEILKKHPLGVTIHFCNFSLADETCLPLLEFLGTSLAHGGAKVFLSGLPPDIKENLIGRGKLGASQFYDSVQESRNAAIAAGRR